MADRFLDSKEEGLIPGLPDDVSMQCLARISHGYEGMAQCVSSRWRDAFRSEEIGRIRAHEGLSGDWLFVYAQQKPMVGWQAYDPAADRWHYLPPAPSFRPHSRHVGFNCVVLNHCLLVLGGHYKPTLKVKDLHSDHSSKEEPSNRVLCFDAFFRKWIELPGMMSPRSCFSCVVIDGRVLVAGSGTISAESFDPKKNTWEALPEMPEPFYGRQAMTCGGYFQMLGYIAVGSRRHFILYDNEWKVVPRPQEPLFLHEMQMTEMDGRLYGFLRKRSEKLVMFDENTREGRTLGKPSYFVMSDPKKSITVSSGFVGLRGRLYLVGGVELYPRTVGMNLATVGYCDPSAGTPLYWHHARPLLGGGGGVLGCAALQQE